jgi:hypothetical protein
MVKIRRVFLNDILRLLNPHIINKDEQLRNNRRL